MKISQRKSGLIVPEPKPTGSGRGRVLFYDKRLGRTGFQPDPSRYCGVDADEAKRKLELLSTSQASTVKLMPCKPFLKGKRSKRVRRHTWVRV